MVAEADALTWAGRCQPGDVLGLVDGEVVLIAPDLAVGALWLAPRMLTPGVSWSPCCSATGRPTAGATGWSTELRRAHPEVDVVVHRGARPGTRWSWGWNDGAQTVDLDTPLPGSSGRRRRTPWPPSSDLHTVGDLVRHYPRRYVERGELTDIAGLELGEHATVMAEVEKFTMRECATPRQDHAGRHHRRARRGGWTARSSTRTSCRSVIDARAAGAVRRPGVAVPATSCSSPTPSSSRCDESEDVRPFVSIYPATAGARRPGRSPAACGRCSTCSTTPRTRCPPSCAAPRASPTWTGAAPDPRAGDGGRPVRRAEPAGLGRGDGRPARAGAAPAGGPSTGRRAASPHVPRRAARRVRRPAAVHAHRGPAAVGDEIAADLAAERTR